MSTELWKSAFDWASVVLIALTFVSGAGALITGGIIGKRQEAKLREFDRDLTEAKTQLGKQQERAAMAERELLQLRQSLKDRSISLDQRQKLINSLKNAPRGPVEIWWLTGESDSYSLALQIQATFEAAGWAKPPERLAVGGSGVGLFIAMHDTSKPPTHAVAIQQAFNSVGITLTGLGNSEVPAGMVQIYIGQKPRVQ